MEKSCSVDTLACVDRFPDDCFVPFAERQDSDDVACWIWIPAVSPSCTTSLARGIIEKTPSPIFMPGSGGPSKTLSSGANRESFPAPGGVEWWAQAFSPVSG